MKRMLLALAIVLLFASLSFAAVHGGTPIVGGGTGIITVPTASTIGQGGIDLGFYFIGPETIALSAGFGLIPKLDLSVGFEIDGEMPYSEQDPFLQLRAKYRFAGEGKGSSDSWAFGVDFAMAMGDQAPSKDTHFTLYIVNSYYPSTWKFSWGFGYTFNNNADENINFMVGLSKEVVQNLYIEMDFSNFPNRYFGGKHADVNRAVGNIAARLHLFEGFLRLTVGLFDAFDDTRQFGLGAALKLSF